MWANPLQSMITQIVTFLFFLFLRCLAETDLDLGKQFQEECNCNEVVANSVFLVDKANF